MYGPDSLIYKKTVFNGNIEGRELLLKTLASNSYSRIRLMHYADSVFVINLKGDKALVTDNNADLFFNSFRFINEHFTSHAFTTKTDLLITDLQSEEAVKRNAAGIVLKNGYRFPASELPKMMVLVDRLVGLRSAEHLLAQPTDDQPRPSFAAARWRDADGRVWQEIDLDLLSRYEPFLAIAA